MAWRSIAMLPLLAALVAILATQLASAATLPPTREPVHFEAAFQGRCGEASPCEQLCRELHDGTYECGCGPGFVLHVDGYGCLELNATSRPGDALDAEEDVLYQKDVSFSAELEIAPSVRNSKTKHIDKLLKTVTTTLPKYISDTTENALNLAENIKRLEGYNSLISDGVSCDDINMIADGDAERKFEDYKEIDEGKVTTQGPSLEQKVPGATSSPPWTAAVENCNCGGCGGPKCSCKCDHQIHTPRFSGSSWLALHALRGAYKRVRLRIRVRPERARGVLLLTGEHDDLSGDYLALILRQGHVELRFDCGSGAGVLRSPEPVRLGRWNTISVYRHRWDAWLKLNEGKKVRGRSKGLFSRMTFREPVWVGGTGNTTGLQSKLGLSDGLLGCVDFLRINGDTYRLTKDAVATADLSECAPTLAPWKESIDPTMETAPIRDFPNDLHQTIYNINDIVHFEDNDIVMRDARSNKKENVDTKVGKLPNLNVNNALTDEVKDEKNGKVDRDEKGGDCFCEHGGGCVGNACLCPLGYAGDKCEITLDLKVPRFNGSSYLRLPGLGNMAASWLDIQITLKPTSGTGLILYNSNHISGDGDFFSLHLREYFVEFAFDLGSGIALVRSAYPLKPNTWHRLSITRSGRRATLRVQSSDTSDASDLKSTIRSVTSKGIARRLSLKQPLLLGGAPLPLPPRLALTASYSGCVGQLVINDEEISVVSSALGGVNVDNCQEPNNTCSSSKNCEKSLETLPTYLFENSTEIQHNIVAKKGFKHHRVKIKKHLLKTKKFTKKSYIQVAERSNDILTETPVYDGQTYMQVKYLNTNEINWSNASTYPSFSGKDSFIHMDDEETMKRLLSYSLDINIRFRCIHSHGLLVWSGRVSPKPGDDFLSLGVEDSVLVFRYDLGSGEVVIVANHTKVDDGLWHRARATRNRQAGVLEVDGLGSVGQMSPGKLKQLNTENGLYIGGLPSIEMNTVGKYTSGLIGCISQISLSGDFDIPLSLSKLPHTITNNVGGCAP